jgi:uncharacterized protein (DUF2267 family)
VINAAFKATQTPTPTTIELERPDAVSHTNERYVHLVYEIARRAAIPTWLDAATSTRATLAALGEWMDSGLRAEVAQHLPEGLGQALTEVSVSLRRGDVVALYRRAAADTGEELSLHDVALRCAAVLAVLGESLPAHVVARLTDELPDDIAALVVLADRRRSG